MNTKWNVLDSIIFTTENKVKDIVTGLKESRMVIPDPETMLAAETNYLMEENKSLKAHQYPKLIVKEENRYYCPNLRCEVELEKIMVEQFKIKFCPECGQRIYYYIKRSNRTNSQN